MTLYDWGKVDLKGWGMIEIYNIYPWARKEPEKNIYITVSDYSGVKLTLQLELFVIRLLQTSYSSTFFHHSLSSRQCHNLCVLHQGSDGKSLFLVCYCISEKY